MFILAIAVLTASATPPRPLHKKVTHVQIHAVEGDVRVEVDASASRIVVETLDRRPGHTCAFELDSSRDRAVLTFGPKSLEVPTDCRMDFTVRLRPDDSLAIALGSGHVDVRDVETDLSVAVTDGNVRLSDVGSVHVVVGHGDIALSNVLGSADISLEKGRIHGTPRGTVTASVGEGHIDLDDLDAPVSARTNVGNIQLAYASIPGGDLNLNAGLGNIVVDLPRGTTVRPDLTAAGGSARCDLPFGTDLAVNAVAGMGSILLR
jgi:DUF4097 and DUF4098 domain-containing protein YvlB